MYDSTITKQEKRIHPRLSQDLPVIINTICIGEKNATVKNISEGGVYIQISFDKFDLPQTSFICLRNERIHLKIKFDNTPTFIEGIGFAKWSEEIKISKMSTKKCYGLGIQFTHITQFQKDKIIDYINKKWNNSVPEISFLNTDFIFDNKSSNIDLKDRRINPRIDSIFPALVASTIVGETSNISESGLCIDLEKPLINSEIISINIAFPFTNNLELHGQIIWTKNELKDMRYKCGVKFLKLNDNELQTIKEVFAKYNILNKYFIKLTKEFRIYIQEIKKQFDEFDKNNKSEIKQKEFIETNKDLLYKNLSKHFTAAWEILKTLDNKDLEIHQKYYQSMLGPLLLDIIEINRYIVKQPLGYAGDFITMNYIYNYSPCINYLGNSSYEKIINAYTCNIPISKSNILRKDFLKKTILHTINKSDLPTILSIAAGSARELTELLEEGMIKKFVEFKCLDFEQKALEFAKNQINNIDLAKKVNLSINYVKKNLIEVVKDNFSVSDGETYDLIYCSGIFDYLSPRISRRLINTLFSNLKKHGILIVINADHENSSHQAYYEILGNWKFIHRKKTDLLEWTNDIQSSSRIYFENISENNNYLFLHIKKL